MVGFWNEGAAAHLRKILEDKGLRPEKLAERIHVSPKAVRNWLVTTTPPTHPSVDNLAALCASLDKEVDEFRAAAAAYRAARNDDAAPTDTLQESSVIAQPEERAEDRIVPMSDTVPLALTTSENSGATDGGTPDEITRDERLHGSEWPRRPRSWLLALAVAAVIVVGVWTARRIGREEVVVAPPVTFEIPPELPGVYDRAVGGELSPDGTQIVFLARSARSGQQMLFVHSVIERTTSPLPGSEGNFTNFFWDVDSKAVFFISSDDLVKIGAAGEGQERIGQATEGLKGAVNTNGSIVLGSRRGLLRMAPSGASELLTTVHPGESTHTAPVFLPDQDRILFTITGLTQDYEPTLTLAVYSLRSRSMRKLFPIPSGSQYVNGQLLYVRARTLYARPFDTVKLRYSGPERPIASPVWADTMTGDVGFSASPPTILVTPPVRIPPLYRVSSSGNTVETIADPPDIRYIAVGRTSNQIAVITRDSQDAEGTLWLLPLDGRERTRIAQVRGEPRSPVFSHDDNVLYYAATGYEMASIRAIDLRRSGRPPRTVLVTGDVVSPRDVSPDGRFLLVQRWTTRDANILYVPVDRPELVRPMVATVEDEGETARFSPDGRQVAFVAKRGREYSVYVTAFPPSGNLGRHAVTGHGWRARWGSDGRRIFFARGAGVFEADPMTRETTLLFEMKREIATFEAASDGTFFVRELPVEQNRTVATLWWPRLVEHPLALPVR